MCKSRNSLSTRHCLSCRIVITGSRCPFKSICPTFTFGSQGFSGSDGTSGSSGTVSVGKAMQIGSTLCKFLSGDVMKAWKESKPAAECMVATLLVSMGMVSLYSPFDQYRVDEEAVVVSRARPLRVRWSSFAQCWGLRSLWGHFLT